jgi:hypothetical protein
VDFTGHVPAAKLAKAEKALNKAIKPKGDAHLAITQHF